MKTNDEAHAESERRSVAANLASVMRATIFAGTVALPMAMLAALDGFESDAEFASAGELWLTVHQRTQAPADPPA